MRDSIVTIKQFKHEKLNKHNFAVISKSLEDFHEQERGETMRDSEQIVTLTANLGGQIKILTKSVEILKISFSQLFAFNCSILSKLLHNLNQIFFGWK